MARINTDIQIVGKGLLLRKTNESDIPFTYSATRYEGFNEGMRWDPPKSKSELLEYVNNLKTAWHRGVSYSFTVLSADDGLRMARISIRKTNKEKRWDVGFWTHPEHQNKGVMTAAMALILDFGFDQLDAEYIEAGAVSWNVASERVLAKNGMTFVGKNERAFIKNGSWVDEHIWSISKKEWLKTR